MAYILSLATAHPDYCFTQEEMVQRVIHELQLSLGEGDRLRRLYRQSRIETRYSVMPNLDLLFKFPKANERNAIYKTEAPKLAVKAAKKALDRWNGHPNQITHVISVSCTGMIAPGIEYFLIRDLGLVPSIQRIGINFMGCFGAFRGLSVATSIVKENPEHVVLLVCTELCTLHGQTDRSRDTFLANALFADGAAACLIGGEASEKRIWEMEKASSFLFPDSHHLMTWDVAESGYAMTLSEQVPLVIRRNIAAFASGLLEKDKLFQDYIWAIHPGGKAILQVIEEECQLHSSQTEYSWRVLAKHGNMSSATFLFVLEQLLEVDSKPLLGFAFGPGLVVEGMRLRWIGQKDQKN